MKKVLFILLLMMAFNMSAQTYKKVGDKFVKIETIKTQPVNTGAIVTIKDIDYPVYESARGKFFIIRTSKNTGNQYKQYLKLEE
jgi:hypothetical protein